MYRFCGLLRRPIKSFFGVIVIALAVCVLCVCLGQAVLAYHTEKMIDFNYTTIALPTAKFQYVQEGSEFYTSPYYLSKWPVEVEAWLKEVCSNNSQIIERVASHGLASAYVPDIVPDNYTKHLGNNPNLILNHKLYASKLPSPYGYPYSCAMLEITVESIGNPEKVIANINEDGSISDVTYIHTQVGLIGTVNRVIGLQEGFRDPTDSTIYISLVVPDMDNWEQLGIVEGERYLIYGMDYQDLDWQLRNKIAYESECRYEIDSFEPEKIRWIDVPSDVDNSSIYTAAAYIHDDHWIEINNRDIQLYQSCSLTVVDKSISPSFWRYQAQADGSNAFSIVTERNVVNETGESVSIGLDEYTERYRVPTIVHLAGTVEDFLNSEEGEEWMSALSNMEINNHAFAVIGVDKLGYIAEFARENARIVEGRTFTQLELDTGAKVCVISESLAESNGLSVGDAISIQYYLGDKSLPYQKTLESGYGTTNPTANFYFSTTPLVDTPEEYIIIGLYRQNNSWGDVTDNLYAFTPNTIFAPKTSVTSVMEYSDQGFFRTIVLKNGALADFMKIVDSAGYEGLFVYYDQGYSVLVENLHNYRAVANRAMIAGTAIYGIILLLYLVLFPGSDRHTLMVMEALGVGRGKKIVHILTSNMCMLTSGTIIGTILSIKSWKYFVDKLISSADVVLNLEINPFIIYSISAFQLCVAFCMTAIVAIAMTRSGRLMTNK